MFSNLKVGEIQHMGCQIYHYMYMLHYLLNKSASTSSKIFYHKHQIVCLALYTQISHTSPDRYFTHYIIPHALCSPEPISLNRWSHLGNNLMDIDGGPRIST